MWGISILADFRPMEYKLSCCVFALGKNVSFNSVLGHCSALVCGKNKNKNLWYYTGSSLVVMGWYSFFTKFVFIILAAPSIFPPKPLNIKTSWKTSLIETSHRHSGADSRLQQNRDVDEMSSSGYSSAINAEYYPVTTETMDTGDYELYDPRIHARPRLVQPRVPNTRVKTKEV